MKQNAGIVTALAVVLALFGISNLPKGSSGTGAASTEQSERGVKPPTKTTGNSTFSYACGQIQERIQPLMADNPDQAWRVPSFCYLNPAAIGDPVRTAPETVTFAIASAPNPISTHLPMLFDRIVEIIEQAAQDNNYSYDSSWLPWNETKSYNRFPDLRAAELSQSDDEKQPGVLVFRNSLKAGDDSPYKRGLVVFLVSELPTGGINREQFNNALGWIELLKGPAPTGELKILGPSFSGSLPSLYRSIQECKSKSAVCRNKIHVSSGSVSSDSSYRWFKERFSGDPLVTFDTALEGDCRVLNRFVTYVSKKQHYDVQHIAILSEDETAFGGGVYEKDTPATPDKKKSEDAGAEACGYDPELTYLYYPRDIATLRSAYEQQSIFNSSKQAAGNNSNTSATTLRGDLSEPANSEHDTVRTYGGQLTPLAQESVLLNITDVLKARKIQFVVLRSTNTLDQIFLSHSCADRTPMRESSLTAPTCCFVEAPKVLRCAASWCCPRTRCSRGSRIGLRYLQNRPEEATEFSDRTLRSVSTLLRVNCSYPTANHPGISLPLRLRIMLLRRGRARMTTAPATNAPQPG